LINDPDVDAIYIATPSHVHKQYTLLSAAAGVEEIIIPDPPHVHQPLIETIVDELNGVGTCPSTAQSGARTTWVIDQILQTYREKHGFLA
jgi:hypothetical protein